MTAPGLDTRDHITALTTLLEHPQWPVYEYGDVPGLDGREGTIPARYLLLQVARRHVPNQRLTGHADRSGWEVGVRPVGRSPRECRAALHMVSSRLDSTVLDIAGHTSTPVHHDATDDVIPDEGWHYADSTWTYAL